MADVLWQYIAEHAPLDEDGNPRAALGALATWDGWRFEVAAIAELVGAEALLAQVKAILVVMVGEDLGVSSLYKSHATGGW